MSKPNRAAWLKKAKWGVFCHYLADTAGQRTPLNLDSDTWNRQVESFDVEALAKQLQQMGAPYFCITLGQNSGFYCSPNQTYDELTGIKPSRLSNRDLIADIARALEGTGTRLMVYLSSHAPSNHREAVEALGCTPPWDARAWGLEPGKYLAAANADARLTGFQRNWEAVIREWSERWGSSIKGWWIDGCFYADQMYRFPDPPNFASLAAAARVGNPESIIAFNGGTKLPVIPLCEEEDYTAGELNSNLPVFGWQWEQSPEDGMIDSAQYHILTYLGEFWGQGKPRFSREFAAEYTSHVNRHGGTVSWDVPITPDGRIPGEFCEILKYK